MSNSLSPKRGKLERPAICSASPPPPIPPAVPESYWGSAWVTPHVGYCSDFMLRCRAWSHLIAADAPVTVTPGPIDWGTIAATGITLHNDNIQRVTHKITNVQDGTHQLPLTFTWASGRPLEHTYHASVQVIQHCLSPVLTAVLAATYDYPWATKLGIWAQTWYPNRPDLPNCDIQIQTDPYGEIQDVIGWPNDPLPIRHAYFTIPYDANATITLKTYWPTFADPSAAETTNRITIQLPAEVGYVWATPYKRNTPAPDTIWLSGAAYNPTAPLLSDVAVTITTPPAGFTTTNPNIPNSANAGWLGYFSTPPPNGQTYTIDATFQGGYKATWKSRIPLPL